MDAVTVRYTRDMMLRATTCFWKRHFGLHGLAALVLLWVGIAVLWLMAARAWHTVALSTGAVIVLILLVGVYFFHRHRALARLARLEDGAVEFRFEEEGLGIASSLGTSMLKWSAFERLWKFPDLWLLFISKQQYLVLPVDELPPEALELVDARVDAAGT
ncbi:MAG: YcxB family protein [Phycisphaerales bacterium]|nr:MAG: YcxB family protein [Phycisphaerales bacterium]